LQNVNRIEAVWIFLSIEGNRSFFFSGLLFVYIVAAIINIAATNFMIYFCFVIKLAFCFQGMHACIVGLMLRYT